VEPRRRARQFLRAATARVAEAERAEAARILGADLSPLFLSMSVWDQRHGLSVCGRLRRRGLETPELLRAALLHDCGKTGARIRLWHRVASVLLRALAPGLWRSDFWDAPGTWRYPFHVYREHPALGARMAAEARGSEAVAELIRLHEDPSAPPQTADGSELAALQAADREG